MPYSGHWLSGQTESGAQPVRAGAARAVEQGRRDVDRPLKDQWPPLKKAAIGYAAGISPAIFSDRSTGKRIQKSAAAVNEISRRSAQEGSTATPAGGDPAVTGHPIIPPLWSLKTPHLDS